MKRERQGKRKGKGKGWLLIRMIIAAIVLIIIYSSLALSSSV